MNLPINPSIKPFYAALLRLDFPKYLISDSFDHLIIELGIDDLWIQCEDFVREQSNVAVLVPGYTGYAEKALGIFLTRLLEKGGQEFIDIIGKIIIDFNQWKKEKVDYGDVQKKLLGLGFSEDEVLKIFSQIEEAGAELTKNGVEPFNLDVFSRKKTSVNPRLCFVLIPFSVKFDGIYEEIKKVVEEKGYECQRADEIYSNHPIIRDIVASINEANFIIADLTARNPNVMYELGIAHQLEKQTILLSQSASDIPFDLNYLRAFIYENSFGGLKPFKEGLAQRIDYLTKNKKIKNARTEK